MSTDGWQNGQMACFDLETTGVKTSDDRVVTACVPLIPAAEFDAEGKPAPRPPKLFQWIADPGIEIPQGATDVHGITTEYAREHGLPAPHVVEDVTGLLAFFIGEAVPIVGANLQYDLTLLDRECRRHGLKPLCDRVEQIAPIIDVMVIDKAADPYRPGSRKLIALAEHYRVKLEGAHDSTADALAAGRIAWRMASGPIPRTPPKNGRPDLEPLLDIGSMKLADLHAAQVKWKAHQARGLARYLKGKGEDVSDVRPEWPFVPETLPPEPEDALW